MNGKARLRKLAYRAYRLAPHARLEAVQLVQSNVGCSLAQGVRKHCQPATLLHGHCPFLSQPCMPLHSFCQMETQQGQVAAIIPCVQHRRVTPPAWELSKARRGTGTELLRSMRPSQGARSNTGATLHHAPCTPGLTHSLDQHHTGTGKVFLPQLWQGARSRQQPGKQVLHKDVGPQLALQRTES